MNSSYTTCFLKVSKAAKNIMNVFPKNYTCQNVLTHTEGLDRANRDWTFTVGTGCSFNNWPWGKPQST